MSKMIPLHISDAAVAACEKEIEKLQHENARLKAKIERLTKAGDAMFECIETIRQGRNGQAADRAGGFRVCLNWLATKEGKLNA